METVQRHCECQNSDSGFVYRFSFCLKQTVYQASALSISMQNSRSRNSAAWKPQLSIANPDWEHESPTTGNVRIASFFPPSAKLTRYKNVNAGANFDQFRLKSMGSNCYLNLELTKLEVALGNTLKTRLHDRFPWQLRRCGSVRIAIANAPGINHHLHQVNGV